MRLWTIQPPEVLKIIEETGRFICDKDKSFWYNEQQFKRAYDWLITVMILDYYTGPYDNDIELPIWAWHTWNWKHKKPDFRMSGLGIPGKKYVCIELEIPDNEVLLSDFDSWHEVLNDRYLNPGRTEKEWEEYEKEFDSYNPNIKEIIKIGSWKGIFDITPFNNDFCSIGKYIQATFWEIKKENVISVKEFNAR